MSNAERNAEIIRRIAAGDSFGTIAQALGMSRSAVAGVSNRAKHPYIRKGPMAPFRNEPRVRAVVKRVTEVGLTQAAAEFSINDAQVWRWWKRLEAIDGVTYPSPAGQAGLVRGKYNSKLNRVLDEIVARRRAGETLGAIAATYGVSTPAIHFALRRAAA